VLKSMVEFIKAHGNDRVTEIENQMKNEYTIELEKFISAEKERVVQEFKNKIQQEEIKMRIQKSAEQNKERIQRMRTVNTLIEDMFRQAKKKLMERVVNDKSTYKTLLKNLLLQGLIKLMEPEVGVRCRKSDEQVVQSVIDEAVDEYKAMMQKEVKFFQGKQIPCRVFIDTARYLPEYSDQEGQDSCMGGIVLHAKKGRIVCSNTLDDRLDLCYGEAIPEIRTTLFPSFRKQA